jgi:hypothetical protein
LKHENETKEVQQISVKRAVMVKCAYIVKTRAIPNKQPNDATQGNRNK